jgi:hypothetical protein
VDEAAGQVSPLELDRRVDRRWVAPLGREEIEPPVWLVLVVVTAVDAEHVFKMGSVPRFSRTFDYERFQETVRLRRGRP